MGPTSSLDTPTCCFPKRKEKKNAQCTHIPTYIKWCLSVAHGLSVATTVSEALTHRIRRFNNRHLSVSFADKGATLDAPGHIVSETRNYVDWHVWRAVFGWESQVRLKLQIVVRDKLCVELFFIQIIMLEDWDDLTMVILFWLFWNSHFV